MRRRSFLVAVVGLGGVLPAAPSHGVAGAPALTPDVVELAQCELAIAFKPMALVWEPFS